MSNAQIIACFLARFAASGFPPVHGHDSARHKDAVMSQPASALYLDCDQDMSLYETVLHFCIDRGWIVEPFGLTLGLGINQETLEATQAGLDTGKKLLAAAQP